MCAWPTASSRSKNWGTEILTDTDLEGQLDLLHSYNNDSLNGSTGHGHTGSTNDGKKISLTAGVSGILPYANLPDNIELFTATRDESADSGTSTIVLTKGTPKLIEIIANQDNNSRTCWGKSDGTNQYCIFTSDVSWKFRNSTSYVIQTNDTSDYNTATVAFSNNLLTFTWIKTGSPSGTLTLLGTAIY